MKDPLFNRIVIKGLFGKPHLNYSLPFEHEKKWLVMNAANGRGKTTLLRTLYHYLSGQWERLRASELSAIYSLKNKQVEASYCPMISGGSRFIAPSIQEHYVNENPTMRGILAELFSYSLHELQHNQGLIRSLALKTQQFKFEQLVKEILDEALDIQQPPFTGVRVLFLPTYRRVERASEEVFPNFVESLTTLLMDNVEALKQATTEQEEEDDDPAPLFDTTSFDDYNVYTAEKIDEELEQFSRRGTSSPKKKKDFLAINQMQVEAELKQYWKAFHSTSITQNVESNIEYQCLIGFGMQDIKQKVQEFSIEAQERPELRERIYQWRDICNNYFFKGHKKLCYSPREHKISVECIRDEAIMHPLDILSSGEKQIVALFAHVLLSELPVFLILDEPELSLSEPWQEMMMEQLSELNNLMGLVVASHSSRILKYAKGRYTKTLEDLQTTSAY